MSDWIDQQFDTAVETHENWLEATHHLNMAHLKEHKKESLKMAA